MLKLLTRLNDTYKSQEEVKQAIENYLDLLKIGVK